MAEIPGVNNRQIECSLEELLTKIKEQFKKTMKNYFVSIAETSLEDLSQHMRFRYLSHKHNPQLYTPMLTYIAGPNV